jgi:hypothetical protein
VLGLGVAGTAVSRALARRGIGLLLADDRPTRAHRALADELGADLLTATELEQAVGSCALLVPAPGVPPRNPVVARALSSGVEVASEIELAYRWEAERPGGRRPMLAITGTDGKTTTTPRCCCPISISTAVSGGGGCHRGAVLRILTRRCLLVELIIVVITPSICVINVLKRLGKLNIARGCLTEFGEPQRLHEVLGEVKTVLLGEVDPRKHLAEILTHLGVEVGKRDGNRTVPLLEGTALVIVGVGDGNEVFQCVGHIPDKTFQFRRIHPRGNAEEDGKHTGRIGVGEPSELETLGSAVQCVVNRAEELVEFHLQLLTHITRGGVTLRWTVCGCRTVVGAQCGCRQTSGKVLLRLINRIELGDARQKHLLAILLPLARPKDTTFQFHPRHTAIRITPMERGIGVCLPGGRIPTRTERRVGELALSQHRFGHTIIPVEGGEGTGTGSAG